MFKTFRCLTKGHVFVDSRSTPGTKVCVRCRKRVLFEGLEPISAPPATHDQDVRLSA